MGAREICGARGLCFKCEQAGHWANECPYEVGTRAMQQTSRKKGGRASTWRATASEVYCYRCGRPDHKAPECYAKWDVAGRRIDDGEEYSDDSDDDDDDVCYRCGRGGHWASQCFAVKNVYGQYIGDA